MTSEVTTWCACQPFVCRESFYWELRQGCHIGTVSMISQNENQAFSSSNHMQRVEARATVLGRLARLRSHAKGSQHRGCESHASQPPPRSVVVNILLARRERREQTAPKCLPTSVACRGACRAGRRVLDRSMHASVCLRHDGGSLSSQCDALCQVLREHQPCQGFEWLVRWSPV